MMSGGAAFYLIHIATAALALLSFAASFICGLAQILGFRKHGLPEGSGRAIVSGLLFLTLSLMAGAWWRYLAWGWYWAWGREEMWLLMVGLMYVAILYVEFGGGWSRRGLAWAEVLAFLAAIFSLPVS